MVLSTENQLSETWSLPVVAILSQEDFGSQTEFGFLRTGLTFKNSTHSDFTLGFAFVDNQPLNHYEFEDLTTQFWVYEQATLKTGQKLMHRLRLENRWINNPSENYFNLRLRYRLEFKQLLTKNLFLKCTNEPFFNFNQGRIDQNRFFLGFNKTIARDVSFEIGYFNTIVGNKGINRIRVVLHLKTTFFQEVLNDTMVSRN
nr:DUF2490 domain-containing protein [Croceivirga thetidis]